MTFGTYGGRGGADSAESEAFLQGQLLLKSLGVPELSIMPKTFGGVTGTGTNLVAGTGARRTGDNFTSPGSSRENPLNVVTIPQGQDAKNKADNGAKYIKEGIFGRIYKWDQASGAYVLTANYGGFVGKNMGLGGMMRGSGTPTSDSIPAMLSNGEYVVKASSVNKYGSGFMDAVNAGSFAAGGMVKNYKSPIIAAYMSGGGFAAHTMMGYKDGGAVSSNIDNSSNDNYNIVINANDSNSAKIIADMVINRINRENSRKSHTRYIAGR
jgi:hypothetical protein